MNKLFTPTVAHALAWAAVCAWAVAVQATAPPKVHAAPGGATPKSAPTKCGPVTPGATLPAPATTLPVEEPRR